MPDGGYYSINEINASNLAALAEELLRKSEQRLLELCDVAESFAKIIAESLEYGLGLAEAVCSLGDYSLGAYKIHNCPLPDSVESLEAFCVHLRDHDFATFSTLLLKALTDLGIAVDEGSFLDCGDIDSRICYVRNPLSDEAFEVFSQELKDPRVAYRSSFKACVAALSAGECGYILLPLEERGGVRLPTVTDLIIKNDLKINAITPVFGLSLDADLKYALVSDRFSLPQVGGDDDLYLELRVDRDGGSLSGILSSIGLFGHSVFRLSTSTTELDGEESALVTLVLRDDGRRGFSALLLYLLLFAKDHITVGIYKNLE